MKRPVLLILFLSWIAAGYSQKTAKVSATYTYHAAETMSVEEAKRTALERAKTQAIADEFGTVLSQSTSTVTSNKNGLSDSHFFSLGISDVKGEWIETLGEPEYEVRFEEHLLVVTCSIKGRIREISRPKVDFIARPLRNGTSLKYESAEFKDGDDLFLYFKSPVDGYVAVYLLDETTQTVYSILPYKLQNTASVAVTANKEYIFFSAKDAEKAERQLVDEYTLQCNEDKEFNTLYVLFSTNYILEASNFRSGKESFPDSNEFMEFNRWLQKAITKDRTIQVSQSSITINK